MSVATSGLVRRKVFGLAGIALLACNPPIRTRSPDGSGAGGAHGDGPGFGFIIPDGSGQDGGPASPPGDEGGNCAEDVHRAERIAVDLLLLVDTSGSMTMPAGTRSKWALVLDALVGFVRDPKSAGLGVGLQFFPLILPVGCASDMECGGPLLGAPSCIQRRVCVNPFTAMGMAPLACSPSPGLVPEKCSPGSTCVDTGRCSVSGAECFAVGQPCPGVMAGTCQLAPRICATTGASCAPGHYQNLAVPIAPLPVAETAIVQTLGNKDPIGGTPTGPAVEGALAHARLHQAANPTHRVALVVATDGLPADCTPLDAAGISRPIALAQAANPSIATYVIGVFTSMEAPMARPLLEQLATAGGTGAPFVLTATDDLGQRFQEALDKIRGSILPCEFMIPPSTGTIDFGKVNVRFKGAAAEEDILYVASVERCDPLRGGWYYDVPPATETPTRVLVCPASCNRFKADASASVSLAFGCKTKVIE
jgi:hypothetical protein